MRQHLRWPKALRLLVALVSLALGIMLWANFDIGGPQWQFQERAEGLFGPFSWLLGIDGLALMLIVLSTFLMPLCILASWEAITKRVNLYMAMFLIMRCYPLHACGSSLACR